MKTLTKKQTKKELHIEIFTGKENAIKRQYKDILIISYNRGKIPIVAIWESKSFKPTFHYRFNKADELFQFISEREIQADKREVTNIQRELEYTEKKKGIVVGSILYSSWGYEQTNIDFYEVLERKNDFVILQQIGQKRDCGENFNDRGNCTADQRVKIGDPFRKKISKYGSINLNSYSWCGLWDGKSLSWSSYA